SSLSAKPGMYVVMVPKHVVAVEVTEDKHLFLVDNHSKSPLPAEGSARLSQKCEAVYKITEKPQPKFIKTEITITKFHTNNIHIMAWDRYENADDICRRLGQFMFKDDKELDEILYHLHSYYE